MLFLKFLPAVFLLSFMEVATSPEPQLLQSETAKFRAGLVFTDIDYAKLREAMAAEGDEDWDLTDEEIKMRLSFTYPTTKWCGPGNTSKNYDDLGSSKEADKCCRAHDSCPESVKAGEFIGSLYNDAYHTRLSCDCDMAFRKCLHNANTIVANTIGKFYFNVIAQKCYRKDFPIKSCKKRGGWLWSKCLIYEFDINGTPKYQWFYVPNYNS